MNCGGRRHGGGAWQRHQALAPGQCTRALTPLRCCRNNVIALGRNALHPTRACKHLRNTGTPPPSQVGDPSGMYYKRSSHQAPAFFAWVHVTDRGGERRPAGRVARRTVNRDPHNRFQSRYKYLMFPPKKTPDARHAVIATPHSASGPHGGSQSRERPATTGLFKQSSSQPTAASSLC